MIPILTPTNGGVHHSCFRPAHAQESVEATPLLEWWPLQDATQYQVEISRDPAFATNEISETVNIPAYSPADSLAQRSLGRTDYGTFYWRVRGYVAGVWRNGVNPGVSRSLRKASGVISRTLGDPTNQLLIGNDPVGDTTQTYDLSSLYAAQQGGDPSHGIPAIGSWVSMPI